MKFSMNPSSLFRKEGLVTVILLCEGARKVSSLRISGMGGSVPLRTLLLRKLLATVELFGYRAGICNALMKFPMLICATNCGKGLRAS